MLRRSFLPMIVTDWLLQRNRYIIDIARYSTHLSNGSHVNSSKAKYVNTTEMKKEIQMRVKEERKKKNKLTLEDKAEVDIINHVKSINPEIINTCPKPFMKICGAETNVLYLINKEAAAKFVSVIMDDLSKNMRFVIELNPGFGILTTELLKAGVPLIHLYEAKIDVHPILNRLCNMYPGRLEMRNFNLIKISQLLYIDRETGGRQVQNILQGIETTKWEDETCIQVIGATSTSNFIRHLIFSLLFRNCLMSHGRPVFYIAIPPSLWYRYTCNINDHILCTTRKVMFQTMFNYKLLGTLNRKDFLPWTKRIRKRKNNLQISLIEQMDYDKMFVAKFEPKINLYSQLSQEDWVAFWYFLRHNMRKRCSNVIPQLEKWVPGCGVRLIAKDYTIFTQFADLPPEKLMELFKEFKSWPEYKTCNFLSSMNQILEPFEPEFLSSNEIEDE